MRLFNFWRSSSSWRVRAALAFKGIDYDYVGVDFLQREIPAELVAASPFGQVPALEWEEQGQTRRLSQSVAIIEYLEERFPTPPLLPTDLYRRAQVRQIVEGINAGTQPLQNSAVLSQVGELGGDSRLWAILHIARGLGAVDRILSETAGEYAVGDQLTLADLYIVPQVYNARRFDIDMDGMPTLLRVDRVASAHPAIAKAHPDQQPDAP